MGSERRKMIKKKSKKFTNFIEINNLFCAVETKDNEFPRLPSGVYELREDPNTGRIFYNMIDTRHDAILDLPSPEYSVIIRQIENFLTPECKERFKEKEFLYKRSTLLYGKPGTGKTCIVNRVAETVVAKGGIVLFNPNPSILTTALSQLDDIQPDTTVVIIFEELDKLIRLYEGDLLNILDGEVQRENVIFLATTNFFHMIPPRIKRPGRFGKSIRVDFPSAEVRRFYLEHKLGKDFPALDHWVATTEGFSIDELSAVVRDVYCLQENFDATIKYMIEIKQEIGEDSREDENPYEDFDEPMTMSKLRRPRN
jgi:hypothetical protein